MRPADWQTALLSHALPRLRSLQRLTPVTSDGQPDPSRQVIYIGQTQVLTPAVRGQMEGILPVCAGAMLWLGRSGNQELLKAMVSRLAFGASGIIIAEDDARRSAAQSAVTVGGPWRVSNHAPQSFIGVLRLLHPAARNG